MAEKEASERKGLIAMLRREAPFMGTDVDDWPLRHLRVLAADQRGEHASEAARCVGPKRS